MIHYVKKVRLQGYMYCKDVKGNASTDGNCVSEATLQVIKYYTDEKPLQPLLWLKSMTRQPC